MHRGAPTRDAAGSPSYRAERVASSTRRGPRHGRGRRGATTQTNTPWSWGSSCDATSTARAGPSPSALRSIEPPAVARGRRRVA